MNRSPRFLLASALAALACALSRLGLVTLVILLVTGCAVPKEAGFPDVASAVLSRTGHRILWNQGGKADAEVQKAVRAMLVHELQPAEAVQVALLKNQNLQATYEELIAARRASRSAPRILPQHCPCPRP